MELDQQDRAEKAAKAREFRREKDETNLQMAGFEAGGLKRLFFNAERSPETIREKKRKEEQHFRTLRRIVNQISQDRLESVMRNVTIASAASYEALIEADDIYDSALTALTRTQENAHILDGRRVYLSQTGEFAIDENRELLTDNDMARVDWKLGMSTAEDFLEHDDALNEALQNRHAVQKFHAQISETETALQNGDIATQEQADKIDNMLATMPGSVKSRYQAMGGTLSQADNQSAHPLSQAPTSSEQFNHSFTR